MELGMESPVTPDVAEAQAPERSLGLLQRAVAIFVRPASAWSGLQERSQWWFPLLIMSCISAGTAALLHSRALVPMLSDAWQDQVANGSMSPEQAQRALDFMNSPLGLVVSVIQQFVFLPILMFIIALVIWFGLAFILGRRMTYRLSLELACWSWLVTIPIWIVTTILAWSRETMKGVHVGFALLLPESETPSRFMRWLGGVLDFIGPLWIWYVVVLVLGASTLSGAPRRQTAWVLGGLYLAIVLLFATLGAMFPAT
jgi:hypothetical protein